MQRCYKAFDGTDFTTEEQCLNYEKEEIKKKLTSIFDFCISCSCESSDSCCPFNKSGVCGIEKVVGKSPFQWDSNAVDYL